MFHFFFFFFVFACCYYLNNGFVNMDTHCWWQSLIRYTIHTHVHSALIFSSMNNLNEFIITIFIVLAKFFWCCVFSHFYFRCSCIRHFLLFCRIQFLEYKLTKSANNKQRRKMKKKKKDKYIWNNITCAWWKVKRS